MEVNISDYLSQEEMKKICIDIFRERVRQYINTESDLTRIISNIGYHTAYEIIDSQVPNFEQLIIDKTKETIENLSTYSVFRSSNGWGDKDSIGKVILEETVKNNKNIIEQRVQEILKNISEIDIRSQIVDIVNDHIMGKIFE